MQNNQIVHIGYSHKNASVAVRDAVSLSPDVALAFIEAGVNNPASAIQEMAVITTCNRTEFYFVSNRPEILKDWLFSEYQLRHHLDLSQTDAVPLILFNEDAVDHLFAVAGGLESMVLGENQILSQVKSSYDLILSSGYQFPLLNRLFQEAIRAGKSVRTNTALCQGAVSISLAAVELARKIYSSFEKRKILLVGAGETNELVAIHFKAIGATQFIVANRGVEKRQKLAEKYAAKAISLDHLEDALLEADVVIVATGSQHYLIDFALMQRVIKLRNHRSLLMVDISSPRNVDPAVSKLDEIFLYDIDHLKNVIAENLEKRRGEIPHAKELIATVNKDYSTWLKSLDVVPTISKLAGYFNQIRQQELEKFVNKTEDREFEHLEQLSKSIVKKLLHYPILNLREMANGQKLDMSKINTIWEIFRLFELEERNKEDKTN
ncbi:MAG TPA: glutamyl-tRNA reductase [Candidatus Marinimicrobia bacterium]|nr:MAG: glutamyl-tRNA reductase [Candidatus Marinimicrobia bacterium CG1_02_48_14]PJA51892.1 MAG: glutamyl-tRNA reductase [Candidatus Marinimicrobia bacterium CG_4_9_14_3_um_filter_48_9]HCW75969.1 glutamyl-tRNA reductase [Candidatus Neomarinimicrobiota bacterium]